MRTVIALFLIASVCLVGKVCFQKLSLVKIPSSPNLKPRLASYQSKSVEKYALGFNNLIGASIWVQLLQKGDHRPVKDGEVSWEYAQVDTLTTLDPNNFRAYDFGAMIVSVLRRDKVGGRLILEKWTKKQPNYWRTWYLLGSHYLLELRDYKNAAPNILKASQMANSPNWLSSLGIRLVSESGQFYQALKTALELLPQLQNYEGQQRLAFRIKSLGYRIQKKHWEEALELYVKQHSKTPKTISELEGMVLFKSRELSSIIESEQDRLLAKELLSEKFEFRIDPKMQKIVSATPKKTELYEYVGVHVEPHEKEKLK